MFVSFAVWAGERVLFFAVWAGGVFFFLLFGRGSCFFFAVWAGGVFFLLFGQGGVFFFLLFGRRCVFFCCLGRGRVLFLLFGRVTGVHSLTGLPGSSLSDPTTKKTKQQKKNTGSQRCIIDGSKERNVGE